MLRTIKNIVKFFLFNLWRLLAITVTLVEAPLFCLWHFRAIRKNKNTTVFWNQAFGHNVEGMDFISRILYPKRVSVFYIPHPYTNPYLPYCFENFDVTIIRSILPWRISTLDAVRYYIYRGIFLFISFWGERHYVVDHHFLYQTLSLANDRLKRGFEGTNKLVHYWDSTGYVRLLQNKIGAKPRLPDHLAEQCRKAISQKHPEFFSKPFVTLHFRVKGMKYEFHDSNRSAAEQKSYVAAVKYLTENGYHAVGAGEVQHELFDSIPGYYHFKDLDLPNKLTNLFTLLFCRAFIGQNSGPFVLCAAADIPSLLADTLPYSDGAFSSRNLLLFKPIFLKNSQSSLSLKAVYRDNTDLAFGYNFSTKGASIRGNDSQNILEGAKEIVAIAENRLTLSEEDEKLCQAYSSLIDPAMRGYYEHSRPPLFQLRAQKQELLNLSSERS